MADIRSSQKYMNSFVFCHWILLQKLTVFKNSCFFERGKNHLFLQQHNLKHVRDLKRQFFDCRTTSQNLKLNVEPAVRAYTLRMKISQGQNKPPPWSHNTPQQMGHLAWRQNTFPCSSFCWTSIVHISYIAFPHLHPLSHFLSPSGLSIWLFPSPSILPSPCCSISPGIFTGASSIDAHISRCLPLQKHASEELAFEATMQDRAELNIIGRFVSLPPEHQLALI